MNERINPLRLFCCFTPVDPPSVLPGHHRHCTAARARGSPEFYCPRPSASGAPCSRPFAGFGHTRGARRAGGCEKLPRRGALGHARAGWVASRVLGVRRWVPARLGPALSHGGRRVLVARYCVAGCRGMMA